MTPEQFQTFAREGFNRVPVYREILADLETPLSSYLKLARGPYSYFLESVQGGEKWVVIPSSGFHAGHCSR